MSKIAVVTDSNSGITQSEAKELGISVLPMPFFIDEKLFLEDITLTQEEFYKKISEDAEISTSQPAPGDILDLWDRLSNDYDSIIYIPMSSGLSSSCMTARMLADEYDKCNVFVVDNQRISITQRQSVMEAMDMVSKGFDAKDIYDVLMKEKLNASIYIAVDTLKYLLKGGRVTPAGAALGAVLNIKPVLQIQGQKLDAFAKVRGIKAAKKKMLNAVEEDMNNRFKGQDVLIHGAYTCSDEEAAKWKEEIETKFPGYEVRLDRLSLSVSCHIGPGSVAIACIKKADY